MEWLLFATVTAIACTAPTPDADPSAPSVATGQESRTAITGSAPAPTDPAAPEGMKPVPGGTFVMGLHHPRANPDEMDEHEVTLAPFYLDVTEVTNADWNECVAAGACAKPKEIDTVREGYAPLAVFRRPDHPVSGISQTGAAAYCAWRNKRLPSEAEFERAARGDDRRMYPWGNAAPTPRLAVYGEKATAPVGSRPDGAGPYGHLDLAGNVWEWSADLYDPFAYTRPSADRGIPGTCEEIRAAQDQLRREKRHGFTGTNPIPEDCDHSLRGGAFNYFSWGLRSANRVHHPGSWKMIMAGLRCAMSPVP